MVETKQVEVDNEKISEIVRKVINQMDELTMQIYLFQLNTEEMIQTAGDVVMIAISLGYEDDTESIKQNIILNWRHKTVQRYSHPIYYKHFFN